MESKERGQQNRCVYCGRYYKADPRTKKTQKSCSDPKCRAKRKRESRKKWLEANHGYFKGRTDYVRQWRKKNPDYQRQWRAKRREIQDGITPADSVKTLVLVIPAELLKNEIQDEIRLVRQFVRCRGAKEGNEIQDWIASFARMFYA